MVNIIEPKSTQDRFWERVSRSSRCWIWTGAHDRAGYGWMRIDGIIIGAHRIAWELAYGPIPDGLLVCHHCDNPTCVRPSHLFLGDHQDNYDDMVTKGRAHYQQRK